MKRVLVEDLDETVVIDNSLATGRGDFSACMLDILFYILADLKKGERFYLIRVKDIEELTGRLWNYQQLRETTAEMGSRVFEIENPNNKTKLLQLWFFSSVEYFDGTGTMEVELSEKIIPFLEDLKAYTSLELKSILSCSSKYAKRFYMMGCQWRSTGKLPQMTIPQLKEILGLKDPRGKEKEQYTKWSQFRERVLDTAINQVNERTDINLSYQLTKRGRSYYWIDIFVNRQKMQQLEIDFGVDIAKQKFYKHLLNSGFSESQAQQISEGTTQTEYNKQLDELNKKSIEVKTNAVAYMVGVYKNKGILK